MHQTNIHIVFIFLRKYKYGYGYTDIKSISDPVSTYMEINSTQAPDCYMGLPQDGTWAARQSMCVAHDIIPCPSFYIGLVKLSDDKNG